VQSDDRQRGFDDQPGRAKWPELVNVSCHSVSYPRYERGEPRVLQPQCKSYQKNGCANLMEKRDAQRHRATIRARRTTAKRA
jgi:hypothetical protein